VKNGKVPKTSPVYTSNINQTVKDMPKYQCSVCGYIYDPNVGDPDSGILAGTLFENIANDWICPICGVTKENFEQMI
jgi:rubredoxin